MDYSTINLDRLAQLRKYRLPATYHLQRGSGNGCYGDPPGYPTYFTRSVYTQYGNNPHRGPQLVITYEGANYVVDNGEDYEKAKQRLGRLWSPLPLDHERTRLWILSTYKHFHHCYDDVERPKYDRPGLLIFPMTEFELISAGAYLLEQKMVDTPSGPKPKYHPNYLEAENAARQLLRDQEIERATRIATPENHQAVRIIRGFYPDYQPELDLIANPPSEPLGSWWETEAVCPGPERCNETQRKDGSSWRHPINGTWCQWCGWHQEEISQKSP